MHDGFVLKMMGILFIELCCVHLVCTPAIWLTAVPFHEVGTCQQMLHLLCSSLVCQ